MATKYDMSPTSPYFGEYEHYNLLFAKGNSITTTGMYSFTSSTSGETYSSTTGGEMDVLNQLKTALINYMALAADLNAKIDLSDYVNHTGYVVTTGDVNLYIATLNPVPISLVDGFTCAVKIHIDNTGASTINFNELGAKYIKNPDGSDVSEGDLKEGGIYTLRYNSTNTSFILQGSAMTTTVQRNFTTQITTELDANDSRFSGNKKNDSLCWSGQCIYATTSTSGAVVLTDITINTLRFLNYVLNIRLKSANNSLSTNAILIDIQKNISGTFISIATDYIKANDFTNTTDYQVFQVNFDYKGVKATNNQIKIVVTLQAQDSVYEVDLDSIIVMPVGLGTFIA